VGIIGTGLIGKEFLSLLHEQLLFLRKERNIDLRILGITNSKKMLLSDKEVDLPHWEEQLEKSEAADLEKFTQHLLTSQFPHTLLVDMTASSEVPKHYTRWLSQGMSIITPNKKANTGSMDQYKEIRQIARKKNKYFLYSTNVGAGLPVIQTLRDLLQTGDHFIQIEGIFSGTLSYIFNNYSSEKAFSQVVKEARLLGYTEPDPRDDLSGMDVARKLVILARELGWELELSQVKLESLVPEALRTGSAEDYLRRLPEFDLQMSALVQSAEKNNEVLRYVGTINEAGQASVCLQKYPKTHAFARINGSDNIVAFRTKRYDKQSLVIQGPGAGPAVTAAGVFADILRYATYLGALP
jgi:aspartokinase/homoserine dehydrogenase 1